MKQPDLMTGRRGPSAGRKDILIQLLDHVIKTFYPEVGEFRGIYIHTCVIWHEHMMERGSKTH